jgi:hypothetical protein
MPTSLQARCEPRKVKWIYFSSLEMRAAARRGRGGGRASAALPLLDNGTAWPRRGALHLPARRSRQNGIYYCAGAKRRKNAFGGGPKVKLIRCRSHSINESVASWFAEFALIKNPKRMNRSRNRQILRIGRTMVVRTQVLPGSRTRAISLSVGGGQRCSAPQRLTNGKAESTKEG